MKYAASTLVDLAVECGSTSVFRCVRVRMIVQELCTHIEAVYERTRSCKNVNNRTGPCVMCTWKVSVVWRSYKSVCALRVLDEGLGNGLVRFHTTYTILTRLSTLVEWTSCTVVYTWPHTVSHVHSRSCTTAYKYDHTRTWHPYRLFF